MCDGRQESSLGLRDGELGNDSGQCEGQHQQVEAVESVTGPQCVRSTGPVCGLQRAVTTADHASSNRAADPPTGPTAAASASDPTGRISATAATDAPASLITVEQTLRT